MLNDPCLWLPLSSGTHLLSFKIINGVISISTIGVKRVIRIIILSHKLFILPHFFLVSCKHLIKDLFINVLKEYFQLYLLNILFKFEIVDAIFNLGLYHRHHFIFNENFDNSSKYFSRKTLAFLHLDCLILNSFGLQSSLNIV